VATTIQDQTKIVRNIDPSTSNPSPLPSGERIKVRGSHEFFNSLLNDFYDSFHIIAFRRIKVQYISTNGKLSSEFYSNQLAVP
jgi:hypothetical protein